MRAPLAALALAALLAARAARAAPAGTAQAPLALIPPGNPAEFDPAELDPTELDPVEADDDLDDVYPDYDLDGVLVPDAPAAGEPLPRRKLKGRFLHVRLFVALVCAAPAEKCRSRTCIPTRFTGRA